MRLIAGLLRNLASSRIRGRGELRAAARALGHRADGLRLAQEGDFEAARRELARAVELAPNDADAHALLGNVHALTGQRVAAEQEYRAALERMPDHLAARTNYGLLLRESGRAAEALQCFRNVLEREPRYDAALKGLASLAGGGVEAAGLLSVAESSVRRAPQYALTHATLGFLRLKCAFEPAGALVELDVAIALGLSDSDTLGNRAIALQDLGRMEEALDAYAEALERDPANVVIRWHRALALLLMERFEEGWDDYDLRLQSNDRPVRTFRQPRWNGEPLAGKTLLVHAEQGLGDEIMFASCYGELIAAASHCIIDCHPKLEAVFRRSFPEADIHGGLQDTGRSWLDAYRKADYQCPAGSVPRHLRYSRTAFPYHRGYLRADPSRVDYWRKRIVGSGARTAVGISWRGGTRVSRSPMRSVALREMLPLLRTEGVLWISLQYDASAVEVGDFARREGVNLLHWPEAIDNYDETAALLCALDMVTSVCTAVIHLCGALGRPVSVLAPLAPEWRYGAVSERMPWYPSVRVYRQAHLGDWSVPIERVRADVRALLASAKLLE